jgi:hypothetical protein
MITLRLWVTNPNSNTNNKNSTNNHNGSSSNEKAESEHRFDTTLSIGQLKVLTTTIIITITCSKTSIISIR